MFGDAMGVVAVLFRNGGKQDVQRQVIVKLPTDLDI